MELAHLRLLNNMVDDIEGMSFLLYFFVNFIEISFDLNFLLNLSKSSKIKRNEIEAKVAVLIEPIIDIATEVKNLQHLGTKQIFSRTMIFSVLHFSEFSKKVHAEKKI